MKHTGQGRDGGQAQHDCQDRFARQHHKGTVRRVQEALTVRHSASILHTTFKPSIDDPRAGAEAIWLNVMSQELDMLIEQVLQSKIMFQHH